MSRPPSRLERCRSHERYLRGAVTWPVGSLILENGEAHCDLSLRCGARAAVAGEVVRTEPEVVFATTGPVVTALQRESSRVPIVFVQIVDPVGRGLVDSVARPGLGGGR